MLFTRRDLKTKGFVDPHVAMQRYLHKYFYDKKQFNKLKWHEKDFFYEHLQILKDQNGRYGFDLLKIPDAEEYLFEKIILIYASGNDSIDFAKKTSDYDGIISKNRQAQYMAVYWKLLAKWRVRLDKPDDLYTGIIAPMRNEKLNELKFLFDDKQISKPTFIKRRNYIDSTFYHIYYKVKCYFDEIKDRCELKSIGGHDFYADVYTYSHILSRHYVPLMNKGIGGTLNEPIPYVDVFELPKSLLELINDYANHGIITKSTEYLLFEMDGMKYILWIKYGVIPNLKDKMGFEIRSFYRCSEQRDINKYEGLTRRHIREGLYAVV